MRFRPLIRLDLGLSTLRQVDIRTDAIKCESGLTYAKLNGDRPGYIVRSGIAERCKQGFLLDTLARIERDISGSQGSCRVIVVLKKDKEHTMDGWGLIVEGLEAFRVLTKTQKHS